MVWKKHLFLVCVIALAAALCVPSLAFAAEEGDQASVPALTTGVLADSESEAEEAVDSIEPPALEYAAYQQETKWQGFKSDGEHAGGHPVSALKVKLDTGGYKGGIAYKVRLKGSGWTGWKSAGEVAGKVGKSDAITGMKVKLTGRVSKVYDVMYRVYDAQSGWKPWTFNGRAAQVNNGLQSFWIKLQEKGTATKVAEGTYYIKNAADEGVVLASPKAKGSATGQQMKSAAAEQGDDRKFYIRNEGHGLVSVQSVSSGLFLGEANGRAVQGADSDKAGMRWRTLFDDGFTLVNAASGSVLTLAGDEVEAGAKAVVREDESQDGQRWVFSPTKLVCNGYYRVKSATGTYLDVAGASCRYDANIQTWSRVDAGAQTFFISGARNGYYRIDNSKSFLTLAVKGASTSNNANVIQVAKTSAAHGLWKPELDRSGKLTFKNKKSGKMLAVAGSSGKLGANVRQSKANGSKGQLWSLEKTTRYSLSGDTKLDHYVANTLRNIGDLRGAYWWVVRHGYREGQRYYSNPHVLPDDRTIMLANDFFAHNSGNCYRFAATFSWLARGLGYKTNVISGWVQAAGGGQAPHGWVEVYQDGHTYVCDPDLQHELPSYNWYMRTYATSPTAYYSW